MHPEICWIKKEILSGADTNVKTCLSMKGNIFIFHSDRAKTHSYFGDP